MISAADTLENNLTQENNLYEDSISEQLYNEDYISDISSSDEDSTLSSNIITIEVDKENPNQVLNPTIQPAIDAANPGDTIILKGNFVHCHFIIDKPLNIVGYDASLGPCPHHQTEGAGYFGVFYVTEGGSGSVFSGITFNNNAKAESPFTFLIRNATDISVNDCTMDHSLPTGFKYQPIIIENSTNVNLLNLFINDISDGIKIINSSNVNIIGSVISKSESQGIFVNGNSSNINIINNSIVDNAEMGINLECINNVVIENNLLKNNGLSNDDHGSGIYVNNNITSMIVKGNIFLNNGLHAIMYDYRTRNLNNEPGADKLTVIDNNYFEGHSSMILHHRVYVERDYGTLKYDAKNDVYGDVGEGNYAEGKSYVYMQHALINNDVPCGFTYYTTEIPWSLEAQGNDGKYDFSLKLVINEVKNGIYQASVVDNHGNIMSDFNSFNITFFLNNFTSANPNENDTFKTILIKNGVAVADFTDVYSEFKSSGNVVTAIFPGLFDDVKNRVTAQFNVPDINIPIDPSTRIIATKLTTFPLSDGYFSAKLVNSKGNAISNQYITFKFNGKTYTAKTNSNGIAKVKVSLTTKKTYSVALSYAGNSDYKKSVATSSIIVKTGTKKSVIKASNVKIKKNKKKTYQFKLTNAAGKAIKSQKISVKLNGKSYSLKTNSKGVAKLSIKLSKVKKYKISIKFLGNSNFKAVSKTATITVTK